MRKLFLLFATIVASITCVAQTPVDNFIVGPYVVDYLGQGDVKYRLRDNIDLYKYFGLKKDTTIVTKNVETVSVPVKSAIQVSAVLGANLYTTKEFGVEGVWKQNVSKDLYLNGGLSFLFDYTAQNGDAAKRTMFELGVPLQVEWSNLNRQKATFFGLFGLTPAFYSTVKADSGVKKSGMLVSPMLEVGGNIPTGDLIVRISVYGKYKINCSTSDFDVYKEDVGQAFIGGKISVVI